MLEGIKWGAIFALIIIVIWYAWAVIFFKWNPARISGQILSKYEILHQNDIGEKTDEKYFAVSEVQISPDKTYVVANATLRNKSDAHIIKYEQVKYKLSSDCGVSDLDCITI